MFSPYIFISLLLITVISCTNATASVTLLGSRIVYPGTVNSIDVNFKNDDKTPYVIQTWFDNGDVNSTPQKINNVPFVITPPVFRIQPKAGQVARIMFSHAISLPQDKETLFWFNMLQIPPSNQVSPSATNAMTVMLRNRVKFFYRPASIGKPGNILNGINVHYLFDTRKGIGVELNNPQPWYASLVAVSLRAGGQSYHCKPAMLAPFSKQRCWFGKAKQRLQGIGEVEVDAINDQGARISATYPIKSQ